MGWFSHLFPDLAAFREQHPEIDSWMEFKAALPRLKLDKGIKARKPAANASDPALRGVARSLANLTSKLKRLNVRPRDAERQELVNRLRELAKAASRRLKIKVEVVEVKETQPVATKSPRQAAVA